MSAIYNNWERLVRATIRREELRLIALRTPSDLSLASSSPSRSASNRVSSSNLSLIGRSFTYPQILQATHNLSSSNIIENGRSGVLFYGVLEDRIQVVVKMVDLSSAEKVSFLNSEVQFFARVSHPNFVPVLGHCLEDWKHNFLVYEYMPNKDLATSLNSAVGRQSMLLGWKTRLKVAIGVAQALCHLHHHCVPPLVHRNVETSSILIDENYDVHLGRLIEVCAEEKDRKQSTISRLLRLPKGSAGHTSGASDGTRAYDVYCFGMVLLELVTEGTSPAVTDDNPSDSWAAPWNNQFSPASGIEEAYRNGEIWDLPNLTVFRYEELQEATRWFRVDNLVDGFGKEYRGRIPNKSTSKIGGESIVVKLFRRDHFGGFEGLLFGHQYWQTEMQILGRLSHPHFIKLHGYCHEDDTLFLVYEYMPKGCLDNHVFLRGYDKLSWGTRRKILIGAARGLAYLHALKRGVIFRDFNIKSILLDASYNAKLRNFGLATIGPPENETHVTSPVVGTSGYGALEYMATGHLSVKCDVYSFGVVMLEVLTGSRWIDGNRPRGEEQLIDRVKSLSSGGKTYAIIDDPRLQGAYPLNAAGEMGKLALRCLSSQPQARPTMKEVVEILERIETSQEL